ncbi:asparagine synthase [Streptomyces sp. Amel2xB2]|uniref:asparagine synthase-related protein n=1 Tax=Streptomyces sp. Amel2xB2 TaxID=1305829 RepID=UPI000DC01F8A|nr:asparagine synthase-related protein [Streptomyces sp. Amel2xB2]RAJ66807.1 asparagine synthase [Streptomyces sp. Amel2xB2]
MRWLVGWSSAAPGRGRYAPGSLEPVGAQLLWSDPDPLWAVGDWRPDEIRVIEVDAANRLAVLGCCGASDEELRLGLSAARGGAYRHLTAWPGSYTAVACVGRRLTVAADLAGVRPVFHTPWEGGTAYATAALPLADLTEAQLDIGHLGALLACPDAPEALGDGTPYAGVRRVPPGHALILREGSREITSYEPASSLVVSAPPPVDPDTAVARVRDALIEAVRARLAAPRHASESDLAAYGSADADAERVADGYGAGTAGAGAGAQGAYGAYEDGGAAGTPYAGAAYGDEPHPDGDYDYGQQAYTERSFIEEVFENAAYGHDTSGPDSYRHDQYRYDAYGTYPRDSQGAETYGPYHRSHGAAGGAPGGGGGSSRSRNGRAASGGAGADGRDPGPVPGMGPADRRAARGGPAPGVGADLSGGPASGTLALLAAGLPGVPGTVHGTLDGTEGGERLLAVTFNDLATNTGADNAAAAELERARSIADDPRLHHVVVAVGEEALPFAELEGPLTDEPGPSLVVAGRHRRRLAAGSSDHFVGYGARQVMDAHPARLADLLMDRRRRHLLRPVAALARADDVPPGRSVLVPWTVYRAARKLARTQYRDGVTRTAERLRAAGSGRNGSGNGPGGRGQGDGPFDDFGDPEQGGMGKGFADLGLFGGVAGYGSEGAVGSSVAALTWCRPGPAARWLTGEALAEVSVRLEAAARLRPTVERPGERRARAALARQAADHRVLEQAAEMRNQRLHAPFYDNQVVRACRDLPEALRVKPGARASVLRAVLAGAGVHDLPAGWGAPSHAYQAASQRAGLRTAASELLALFDAPLLAEAGLVEARVVRKAIRAASQGEPLPLDGLADLVSTELWLRRLISRRGTCWTGSAAPRQRAVASGVLPAAQERPAL